MPSTAVMIHVWHVQMRWKVQFSQKLKVSLCRYICIMHAKWCATYSMQITPPKLPLEMVVGCKELCLWSRTTWEKKCNWATCSACSECSSECLFRRTATRTSDAVSFYLSLLFTRHLQLRRTVLPPQRKSGPATKVNYSTVDYGRGIGPNSHCQRTCCESYCQYV